MTEVESHLTKHLLNQGPQQHTSKRLKKMIIFQKKYPVCTRNTTQKFDYKLPQAARDVLAGVRES